MNIQIIYKSFRHMVGWIWGSKGKYIKRHIIKRSSQEKLVSFASSCKGYKRIIAEIPERFGIYWCLHFSKILLLGKGILPYCIVFFSNNVQMNQYVCTWAGYLKISVCSAKCKDNMLNNNWKGMIIIVNHTIQAGEVRKKRRKLRFGFYKL